VSYAESTCPKTSGLVQNGATFEGAGQARVPYPWVRYRESRCVDDQHVYVFTDGSSLGGYGAVVVEPGKSPAKYYGFTTPTKTRNVGAELNGAMLGLSNAPIGSAVVLVCDYLGVAAWLLGFHAIREAGTADQVEALEALIAERRLTVSYVHHRGHQQPTNGDDFTYFNTIADELADEGNRSAGVFPKRKRPASSSARSCRAGVKSARSGRSSGR